MGDKRRVLLVQNGRSTRGIEDRFCGFTDPPLSPEGRQAVLNLRDAMGDENWPTSWYVSDRRRAVETFEILTAGARAPVVRLTEALREIHFGDYENLTWEELPDEFRRKYTASQEAPMELAFPRGESFAQLCKRVTAGLLEFLSYDEDNAPLGLVGHQGSLRVIVLVAEKMAPNKFFAAEMEPAERKWVELSLKDVATWRREYLQS